MKQEIKPTYVTFEQAKQLKEKGFDESCYRTYNHEQKLSPFPITENMGGEKVDPLDYKWNNSSTHSSNITAPEQWQVVEWLLQAHKIDIDVVADRVLHTENAKGYTACIYTPHVFIPNWDLGGNHKNRQEAYSAAFDYVLTKLI